MAFADRGVDAEPCSAHWDCSAGRIYALLGPWWLAGSGAHSTRDARAGSQRGVAGEVMRRRRGFLVGLIAVLGAAAAALQALAGSETVRSGHPERPAAAMRVRANEGAVFRRGADHLTLAEFTDPEGDGVVGAVGGVAGHFAGHHAILGASLRNDFAPEALRHNLAKRLLAANLQLPPGSGFVPR